MSGSESTPGAINFKSDVIIAKSYNRALKRFVGGFYGRIGAVSGRDIAAYRGIMKF